MATLPPDASLNFGNNSQEPLLNTDSIEKEENPAKYHPAEFASVQPESDEDTDDTNLVLEDSFFLVRQRIENLREKIGITVDESLELRGLESMVEDAQGLIPEDLGIAGKTDKLMSALESKRVDRYLDEPYDGGEIDDDDEGDLYPDPAEGKQLQDRDLDNHEKKQEHRKKKIMDHFPAPASGIRARTSSIFPKSTAGATSIF